MPGLYKESTIKDACATVPPSSVAHSSLIVLRILPIKDAWVVKKDTIKMYGVRRRIIKDAWVIYSLIHIKS